MFNAFYKRYVAACAALNTDPLSRPALLALIRMLLERENETVQ
jgi:hypothetical protein